MGKNVLLGWTLVAHAYNLSFFGRTGVQGQPRQIVHKTPSPKMTSTKMTGVKSDSSDYWRLK
jgi:hypothetical protein